MEDALLDSSFEGKETIDLNSVIAEFPNNDDFPGKMIPKKKLSQEFEGCVKSDEFMKVFLRIRPISSKNDSTIIAESDTSILTTAPENSRRAQYTKLEYRNYIFSKVFGPNAQQQEVYEQTASSLVSKLFKGENCVLFAYGMTNAGKTYTIQGDTHNPGLLPRIISTILQKISGNQSSSVEISMLEIYQEKIYDLLSKSKEKLSIRDGNGKVEVSKLTTHHITSIEEATKHMSAAATKRSKATTFLNTGSSRSHAVYTVTLKQQSEDQHDMISSEFHLVDLAGSERSNRTKASSAQQKEANNINVSLMQLWRCLQGMRRFKANSCEGVLHTHSSESIIPFRESKLTHLLMPILSRAGSGGVSMIACVNPHMDDYDETLSILGNASLALKIKEFADLNRTAQTHLQAVGGANLGATGQGLLPLQQQQLSRSTTAPVLQEELKDKQCPTQPRVSNATVSSTAAVGAKRRWEGSNNHAISAAASKKRSTGKAVHSSTLSSTMDAAVDTEAFDRMKREMEELRKENILLAQQQMSREAEIRMEVSQEMAQRSNHLLEQIQLLRDQLAAYESHQVIDVRKSAKKARKQQLNVAQEGTSKDLQEAEEELERMKSSFESQIASLMAVKTQLETELHGMKGKGSRSSMQEKDTNGKASKVSFNSQNSPGRSPLSTVTTKVMNASPVNEVLSLKRADMFGNATCSTNGANNSYSCSSNNNGGILKSAISAMRKATASPQRIRSQTDENQQPTIMGTGNAGATYMTRLRSQGVKL